MTAQPIPFYASNCQISYGSCYLRPFNWPVQCKSLCSHLHLSSCYLRFNRCLIWCLPRLFCSPRLYPHTGRRQMCSSQLLSCINSGQTFISSFLNNFTQNQKCAATENTKKKSEFNQSEGTPEISIWAKVLVLLHLFNIRFGKSCSGFDTYSSFFGNSKTTQCVQHRWPVNPAKSRGKVCIMWPRLYFILQSDAMEAHQGEQRVTADLKPLPQQSQRREVFGRKV